ncbi:MAG: ribosome maturation factor RimP [Actinomycetota bacterium]
MNETGTTTTEIDRVRALAAPIASDLQLDLYDVERRGGTIRITLDTPPGSEGGVTLDTLSLATRMISQEIDVADPVHGKFTLEVTSPGLERPLRTPAHFQREIGKDITVKLVGRAVAEGEQRRIDGRLSGATDHDFTILLDDGTERTVAVADVDKARTVFEWGPKPKPGKGPGKNKKSGAGNGEKKNGTKQNGEKETASS